MADGGTPNKNRADSALTIYRDAMRQYIASIFEHEHGPNWIRLLVLNEQARARNERSHARRLQSLEAGAPPHSLIDLADIPFLIDSNRRAFPTLARADITRMHTIRDLPNSIQHFYSAGDCTREETDAAVGLCILALERCGLSEAAESIRSLSSASPALAAPEADPQKEHIRREWGNERQQPNDSVWGEEWEKEFQDLQERLHLINVEWERLEEKSQQPEQRKRRAQEFSERLSAGGLHSLGLHEDGTVLGWGGDGVGQYGAPAGNFVAVSAGGSHSLGLCEDGTVVGWGDNSSDQCDAPAGNFVAVSAGGSHSLGLREDGTVVGWGSNDLGQCDAPVGNFIAVSAGGSHSLGLCEDGTVVGWGSNDLGQCDAPVGNFVAVSAGGYHSLGLREDGTAVGWGDNSGGRCDVPVGNFVAVSAGGHHSLGLREDGTVVGWGDNVYGECDAPMGKFVAVCAGGEHSLGLRDYGTIVVWGNNYLGQHDVPFKLWIL